MTETEWKDRFVARFIERLTKAGSQDTDIQEMARDEANGSYEVRDQLGTADDPEEAADGEYDALCESV